MLQLDGYDLIGDNEELELQSFINKYIPLDSFCPWMDRQFPGWGLSAITLPAGRRREQPWKLNRFVWPTRASMWAYGHFLCDSDTVGEIVQDAYGDSGQYNLINFSIGNPESNPGGTIVAGETVSVQVYLLPPTPLSGIRGLTGMTRSLYLLTIVDARYFWWWQNLGNISITTSTTWQSLITQIAGILNITINNDPINAAYLAPSIQSFMLPYEPVPMILDAIAYNIGMRFVAGLDGSYSMQLYNTALQAINSDMANYPNRAIVSGGQKFSDPL